MKQGNNEPLTSCYLLFPDYLKVIGIVGWEFVYIWNRCLLSLFVWSTSWNTFSSITLKEKFIINSFLMLSCFINKEQHFLFDVIKVFFKLQWIPLIIQKNLNKCWKGYLKCILWYPWPPWPAPCPSISCSTLVLRPPPLPPHPLLLLHHPPLQRQPRQPPLCSNVKLLALQTYSISINIYLVYFCIWLFISNYLRIILYVS